MGNSISAHNIGLTERDRDTVDLRYKGLSVAHDAILWSFYAKIVFRAKQVGKIQIPDFTLSVGQKNQIDFV